MMERVKGECREIAIYGDPNPGEESCEGFLTEEMGESFKCKNCAIYYKNFNKKEGNTS